MLEQLLEDETAGDPCRSLKWKHKSLARLSAALGDVHPASPPTVGRLLEGLDYSRKVNHKALALSRPHRNEQFEYLQVCHYPTGASKWNWVEHRLFSPVSGNWAGEPLDNYAKMLGFLNATTTEQGLVVRAVLTETQYQTKIKISDQQMAALNLTKHDTLPQWNYTIHPSHNGTTRFIRAAIDSKASLENSQVIFL